MPGTRVGLSLTLTDADGGPVAAAEAVPGGLRLTHRMEDDAPLFAVVETELDRTTYRARALVRCPVPPARLVVNEVDYQNQGPDSRDFVEILNAGLEPAELAEVSLQLLDGGGEVYLDVPLGAAAERLGPGQYLVVGNPIRIGGLGDAVPTVELPVSSIRDRPGAVRLVRGEAALDSVAFGEVAPGVGEGDAAPADPGDDRQHSIARVPEGADTGDNSVDFQVVQHSEGRPGNEPAVLPAQVVGLALGQGAMVGEVNATEALLQTRLTEGDTLVDEDLPGAEGVVRFEWSRDPDFAGAARSPWYRAELERDSIVRHALSALQPGVTWHYRVEFGADERNTAYGAVGRFKTPSGNGIDPVSFVAVSCMAYDHYLRDNPDPTERALGFRALAHIRALQPDAMLFTGDTVYYDTVLDGEPATDVTSMRRRWHQQFRWPRFRRLFAETATYWQKDDHDFRYNDADLTSDRLPTVAEGLSVFREQVPVAAPNAPTWRTIRINHLVQLWLVEGRDHRSANRAEDSPDKSLWGAEQRAWLQRTLLESDAPVRLLVSPTPLVGPDSNGKADNHTNSAGFRSEGEAFLAWAAANDLVDRLFIIAGDRHWQYASRHPTGIREFQTGSLNDGIAFPAIRPGDPRSTDPDGEIDQLWASSTRRGGFLRVQILPDGDDANVVWEHFDSGGRRRFRHEVLVPDAVRL